TGAAHGAPPALDDARALQQRGALREAQKAYEALLPELRSSDLAALGAALNALSQIASAQGNTTPPPRGLAKRPTFIVRSETGAARRTQSNSSASQSSTRRITRPHSIS